MKIIAHTGNGKYLVDVSADELARLDGFTGDWSREREGKKFSIGDQIDVNRVYNHQVAMKSIKDQLARAKGIIDTVSASITLADTIIEHAQESPKVEPQP
jgi:hypothetical protein